MYKYLKITFNTNESLLTERIHKCSYINKLFDNHHGSRTITAQLIILQKPLFCILCLTPTPITHTKMSQNNHIRSIILYYYVPF